VDCDFWVVLICGFLVGQEGNGSAGFSSNLDSEDLRWVLENVRGGGTGNGGGGDCPGHFHDPCRVWTRSGHRPDEAGRAGESFCLYLKPNSMEI